MDERRKKFERVARVIVAFMFAVMEAENRWRNKEMIDKKLKKQIDEFAKEMEIND